MKVDELTLLRELVVDEPMDDAAARAEVWRRLGGGKLVPAGDRRRRIVVALAAAAAVVVVAASAFATVSELYFDPRAPRKESRTVDGVQFTFTVPARWENGPAVKGGESPSGAPEFRIGNVFVSKSFNVHGQHADAVIFWTAFPDGGDAAACRNLLIQDIGGSTVDLAAAMAKAPGIRVVQRPTRVSIDGYPATYVVLSVRRDRGCDPGYFFTWQPSGLREGLPGGQCWGACWITSGVGDTLRMWIVDVDGKRLVVAAQITRPEPGLHPHARDEWTKAEREIASIIRSVRFR